MTTRIGARRRPGRFLVFVAALGLLTGLVAPASAQMARFHGGFGHFGFHSGFGHFGFHQFGFHHHSRTSFFFGLDLGFYPAYEPVYVYPSYYYPPPVYSYPVYVEPTPPRPRRYDNRSDDNDYYLYRRPLPSSPLQKDPGLAQAVADIQTAFRNGDIAPLERHIISTDMITVQSQGRTRRSLAASDYLKMTKEALEEMKTVRYDLDHVEPASNGNWMVYGTHVLRETDGTEKQFNVGFILKRRGDNWVISEVTADPAK